MQIVIDSCRMACQIIGTYPSVRPVEAARRVTKRNAAATPPAPVYEYRQRPNERLYEVNVSYVRAVVGPPEQRCWVERQQVVEPSRDAPNVPGAIVGGIIGGVLGHQIGGGRGQDVATAGGAVAGAAIGANVGRGPGTVYSQDVQRCAAVPGSASRVLGCDVLFSRYRTSRADERAARPMIWVNGKGEPRG
jgi:uncharacterized protein YcfJ